MLAIDLVSDLIPLVSDRDTVQQALNWMDLYRVIHLPVSDGSRYLGLVSESDLLNYPEPNTPVSHSGLNLINVHITDNQHIYEAIERMASLRLTLMPVLDSAKEYKGCITLPDLLRGINQMTAAGQPGAILLMSMAERDYALSTISRIIEENNAKVLSLYVTSVPESREVILTIKVNSTEVNSMIRSLERFGYPVKTCFLNDSQSDEFYRSRYEELMKYMGM